MFGSFIKENRLKADLTLREFCRLLDEDASNWSKVEREVLPPPRDELKLKRIAGILGFQEHSDDWNMLHDYASIDAGIIPKYITSDKEVLKSLPIFFRTIGSIKPNPEEITGLINTLKRSVHD